MMKPWTAFLTLILLIATLVAAIVALEAMNENLENENDSAETEDESSEGFIKLPKRGYSGYEHSPPHTGLYPSLSYGNQPYNPGFIPAMRQPHYYNPHPYQFEIPTMPNPQHDPFTASINRPGGGMGSSSIEKEGFVFT